MSRLTRVCAPIVVTLAVLVGVVPSYAQFVGGAAPAGTTLQKFSTTGVAHGAGLSTIFTCTNTGDMTAEIAVELFDQNGAAQNNSPALSVPPGGTVQFATSGTAPFSADQLLAPANAFSKGSAKIWANTKLIICEATRVSSFGGTLAMAPLPVIYKMKQKGQ